MDDKKKIHIKTFSEFFENRKENEPEKTEKKVDWDARKTNGSRQLTTFIIQLTILL